MTFIAIALSALTLAVLTTTWFYYRRTKRLLNRSREFMQHSVDNAFIRIENRLVHGVQEFHQNPEGRNIWAIVFSYDRKSLTERAIESLHLHEPALPILAIDNGSTDGTCELLVEKLNKRYINKVLLNRHNEVPQWQKSFAINQALRLLAMESPDYIVWMDDDTTVQRPFLDDAITLLHALQSDNVRVISMTDDEIEERNHPTIKQVHIELPNGMADVKIRASFNGQFNLFSSNFFREFGMPPIGEGIRNYAGEDWYYSRRLQSMDYHAAVFPCGIHAGAMQSKREEIERATRE